MTDSTTCPCGMNRKPAEGLLHLFTLEWHVAHRERHLAAFPNLDIGSRVNLDEFVRRAS